MICAVVGLNIVNQFTAQIMDSVKFGVDFMLLEANPAPQLGNDNMAHLYC